MLGQARLFCFGAGYSAGAFARLVRAEGWRVAGTCRTAGKQAALAAEGFETYRFDRGQKLDACALEGATHVLVSVPPDEQGDSVFEAHGCDLKTLPDLRWLGYLSTTGVYGDRGGDWVDEDSDLRATEPRSRRRIAAENAWLGLWREARVPVHIFRLAGIYGPGRSAFDALRSGNARRIHKPGQVFSRIHVEDIARILRASIARPAPGTIYNICDDAPAPADEVLAHAAALLGQEPPPLVPIERAALSEMAASFYRDNRRVRNARVKNELGIALLYPDYRRGLAAILAAERG
ncbi:MAG: SDR family oxidoreductase [Alphaproteobacteria bacterium]